MNITINPALLSNAAGTFSIDTNGLIQGFAYDDPAIRNELAGGVLASTETLPMWGGVGICEFIPTPPARVGGNIVRAAGLTGATALTGFSVFDQNFSAINSPQSQVPLIGSGGQVNFYRLGCGIRLAVACDPALSSLEGAIISPQVSWDFISQRLVKYSAAYVANPITGATWASTSGGRTTFTVTNDLSAVLAAGNTIDVSGIVQTGVVAGTTGFNGTFVVVSVTSTTIVVTQVVPGNTAPATYTSGGSVAAGGGALPVKILDFQLGNSMQVTYDSTTGFANWNRSGNCAIIQI